MAETTGRDTTALEILLGSAVQQTVELWMEYDEAGGFGTDVAAVLFLQDADERYQVSEWFTLGGDRLDEFDPFSTWRPQQVRLDVRPEESWRALQGVSIPLVEIR